MHAFLYTALEKGYFDEEGLNVDIKMSAETNAEVEKKSLQMLLPWMDAGDKPFGWQDAASWEAVASWMQKGGLIRQAVAGKDCFVNVTE